MPIPNNNPLVVPPKDAVTYNLWWMNRFSTTAPDVNKPPSLMASFIACRKDGTTGLYEPAPIERPDRIMEFFEGDIFTLPFRRPDLDAICGQILDNLPAIKQACYGSNILALLEVVSRTVGAMAQVPHPVQPPAEPDPVTPPPELEPEPEAT